MISETWKDVVGYEGLYEVSDLGRIRSRKLSRGRLRREPRLMTPARSTHNRPKVLLYKDGTRKDANVYRLVLEAFVGPCPPGMEACHWDGDSMNSRLDNLRWDTHRANVQDVRRHGRRLGNLPGELHPLARITWNDVRAIRAEPTFPGVIKMLAEAFGLSPSYVSQIRSGKFWKGDGPVGASPSVAC